MATSDRDMLTFIMEKEANSPQGFVLWGCRGEGKGCKRNSYRNVKKHCENCILADESETIEQFQERLQKGEGRIIDLPKKE